MESSAASSSAHIPFEFAQPGPAASAQAQRSRAAQLAATRGLSVTTNDKASRRHSRMIGAPIGLPASPRPPAQDQQQQPSSSGQAQHPSPEGSLLMQNPHSPAVSNSPHRPA